MQDAIFSRGPEGVKRTGMFIGGKRAIEALDMMERAKKAMVPPFEISVFADPAGSFTTAAAMVACCKKALREKFNTGLKGKLVVVFGGTGVVGFASAVIAAVDGAEPTLVGYDGPERVRKLAQEANQRFAVKMGYADGSTDGQKAELVREADVIFAAGPAGRQLLSSEQLKHAKKLLVVTDVNAVPPAGVEGVGVHDDAKPVAGTKAVGIGALAVGNIKYKTEAGAVRGDDRLRQAGLSRLPRSLRSCPKARRLSRFSSLRSRGGHWPPRQGGRASSRSSPISSPTPTPPRSRMPAASSTATSSAGFAGRRSRRRSTHLQAKRPRRLSASSMAPASKTGPNSWQRSPSASACSATTRRRSAA